MASRFNLARSSSVSGIMGGGSIFSIKIIIQNPSWKGKSSRCVWFQFRMSGGGANVLKSVPLGDGCLPRVIRRSGQIEHFEIAGLGNTRITAIEMESLTPKEFASLLAVGNARVNDPVPVIPTEHSARLIELGYMAYLQGRLRITTPGRVRIAAGLIAG